MRPRTSLPDAFSRGPFTTRAALEHGLGEKRLRGADLARPFHGVRTALGAPKLIDLCRAKQLTMREGQVFSHATACRLIGIVVPARLHDDRVDVAAFTPNVIPRGAGVHGHRLAAGGTRTATFRGLPIVSPEDAWCQLAGVCSIEELVIAGDSLVRRKDPISTSDRLRAAVARHRGRRGHRRLVAALDLVRPNTDSPEETRLRLDLVSAGLPEPLVNPAIFDARGRFIGFGDLVYEECRVVVEYDGEQHRTDDRQYARDLERLEALAAAGWRVIRFTKRHRGAARLARLDLVRATLAARRPVA